MCWCVCVWDVLLSPLIKFPKPLLLSHFSTVCFSFWSINKYGVGYVGAFVFLWRIQVAPACLNAHVCFGFSILYTSIFIYFSSFHLFGLWLPNIERTIKWWPFLSFWLNAFKLFFFKFNSNLFVCRKMCANICFKRHPINIATYTKKRVALVWWTWRVRYFKRRKEKAKFDFTRCLRLKRKHLEKIYTVRSIYLFPAIICAPKCWVSKYLRLRLHLTNPL